MARRPRFTTPFSRARDLLTQYAMRPLNAFQPRTQLIIGFLFLVAVTTGLLFTSSSSGFSEEYREGEVVRGSVVARADITAVDIAETEKRRNAARQATRPIFNFDSTRGVTSARSFRTAWEDLRHQIESKTPANELTWRGEGGSGLIRAFRTLNPDDLDRIVKLIRDVSDKYIHDDADADRLNQEIVLVDVRNPSAQLIVPAPRTRMTSLSAARQELELKLLGLPGLTQDQKLALSAAVLPLIRPNVVLDQTATATAREREANNIPNATITLKRNQSVAREGDPVTPTMLAQFAALKNTGQTGRPWHHLLGLMIIVFAVFWIVWKFTEHRSTASALSLSKTRAFALVGSAIVVQTALMRVGFTLGDAIAGRMMTTPFNEPMLWNFAIPFAAAALLVVMLVDTQLAFLTGIVTALFAGMLAPPAAGVQQAIYAMTSCAAAVYGIGRYRERQSVTLAGLLVGAVNGVMAVALLAYAQQPMSFNLVLLAIGCGFVGGLLTATFAAGGLPINESVFGILTDVKLLELSNADLPVLGQLALRAPGTNQHSHAVGQLAEDACRAVGANPLLARIGALYHDIGKVAAPEYFVENQQGENPHDHMRPSQSARIITSHVTYGMKLAKEINLPQQLADFIPQHHGTRTLHFFLKKAQSQAKPGEVIDEKDFRYPGPKPQFKEAAIMMLADSCEAAARSLARPDPDNIRAIVVRIVDAIVSDGQLDECDLTLQELTTIREAVISALTAIYHARIDYPGFNPPKMTGPLSTLPSPDLDSEERGITYTRAADVPINPAGEVEDEAISRRVAKR